MKPTENPEAGRDLCVSIPQAEIINMKHPQARFPPKEAERFNSASRNH